MTQYVQVQTEVEMACAFFFIALCVGGNEVKL